ncbi:MAG: nitrophenyl compound nitroreductase subunit ArsF family protein [Bacteroidota bacterium]
MKKLLTIFCILILTACAGLIQSQTIPAAGNNPRVEIFYFHPTERCPIDQSIEENARRLMQSDFGKNIREGSVRFRVLNTDDKANAKIVSKFEINAQALYIVKAEKGKEIKTDLTEFAFSYGLSNPAKFKSRLKDEILNALK